ncbi:glutathione S-transferase-like protein [Collimonas fungivorans Ter331]|uniref:Glutathione S-transferase-like protein n=1 Tax=Collimonas fungivorans (strain Ter331) TaxID=1005048 RepID=G0A8B3_COLFT|nr:glutathione S-transferase-like protein [Collimonas fungivorans Ter331]
MVAHQAAARERDALVGRGGVQQMHGIIVHRACLRFALSDAGGGKPRFPAAMVGKAQQGMAHQFLRRDGGMAGSEARAAYRENHFLQQALVAEMLVPGTAVPDGDIGIAEIEFAQFVAAAQADVDMRMLLVERRQPRHQPGAGERWRHADAQGLRRAPAFNPAYVQGAVQRQQRLPYFSRQQAAAVGQHHLPAFALEQLASAALFQRADLVADGAVRQVQLFSGAGIVAQPRGGFKRTQGLGRRQSLKHECSFLINRLIPFTYKDKTLRWPPGNLLSTIVISSSFSDRP